MKAHQETLKKRNLMDGPRRKKRVFYNAETAGNRRGGYDEPDDEDFKARRCPCTCVCARAHCCALARAGRAARTWVCTARHRA